MSKGLTFLALVLSAFMGYTQSLTLPVTFEDLSQNYTFTDFGGNATTVITDPTDPSNKVARSVKTASAQIWAGTSFGTPNGFDTPIPFSSTETSMNVRVWSPVAGVQIRLKVEDHNNDTISVETKATTTVAGAWEILQFDFSNEIANTPTLNLVNTYDLASIHFNYGVDGTTIGADSVYYWDDVKFGNAPGTAQINLPVTFEDPIVNYTLTDFGGNATTLVTDPTIPGNTVARSVKTPTAQLWAGTNVGTPDGFVTPIPFTATETKMNVRVWSSVAGVQIRLKAEDHQNATISVETRATTTVAGSWEILEFDFSNEIINTPALDLSNTYDLASIHFNYGANGAAVGADSVYYWDNVTFGSAPKLELPVTFEDPFENYTLTDFGGNASTVVTDPIDPTNTVARTVKTTSAQVWAGTNIGTPEGFGTKIPFSATETKMNVRVWSPVAGVQIRLKAEYHLNNNLSVETRATTTVAGAWETLEFDFSNEIINTAPLDPAYPYDLLSIHFNFGVDGASVGADSVYYWDDVYFGSAPVFTPIDLPVTFEDSMVKYKLTDFGGNASTILADPTDPSNTVARSIKTVNAQIWAGTTIGTPEGFATPIPFTATETKMNVRVWSPVAGVQIRLKAEDQTNNMITVETRATTTVAGAWETLEFDFGNEIINTPALDPANTYNLASIHFNYGVNGASAGADSIYYWDDVMFGPAPRLDQIDLPVTFEDSLVEYTVTDFGGNATTVVADPIDSTNTVARSVKTASAQIWAGTSIGTPEGFATPIPFTATDTKMNVRVWSPVAGVPIRLKAEDAQNDNISVETRATTTVAGAWETLEFDFSNEIINTPALDPVNTYNLASIHFNYGADGASVGADSVYYWDDVMFGPAPVGIDYLRELDLRYYPNPVVHQLFVSAAERMDQLVVLNQMGQEVMIIQASSNEQALDLSGLSAGVYFIKVSIDDAWETFKVLKD